MRLEEYLDKYRETVAEFSKETKMSIQTLYNIMNGTKNTRLVNAMKIEQATRGEVTYKDLLPQTLLKDLAEKNSCVAKKKTKKKYKRYNQSKDNREAD